MAASDTEVRETPQAAGESTAPEPIEDQSQIVIRPRGTFSVSFAELWAYRELLGFLVWRDIKVRYKQTVLGGTWAILQPFTAMVIFSVIFGGFANIPSEGLPYPLFAYAGLLPWTYFASCLNRSSGSIVGSTSLVTKVYFPRLVVPLATVITPVIDFLLSFTVLIGMMAWYGVIPSWHVLALPLFLLLALMTALGIGLWFAALNVRYRDVMYTIPFLAQIWMYASPVVYPVSIVPDRWQWILGLNPMTGVIEGFRWALLGQQAPSAAVLAASALAGALLLATGIAYFRKGERDFADVI